MELRFQRLGSEKVHEGLASFRVQGLWIGFRAQGLGFRVLLQLAGMEVQGRVTLKVGRQTIHASPRTLQCL